MVPLRLGGIEEWENNSDLNIYSKQYFMGPLSFRAGSYTLELFDGELVTHTVSQNDPLEVGDEPFERKCAENVYNLAKYGRAGEHHEDDMAVHVYVIGASGDSPEFDSMVWLSTGRHDRHPLYRVLIVGRDGPSSGGKPLAVPKQRTSFAHHDYIRQVLRSEPHEDPKRFETSARLLLQEMASYYVNGRTPAFPMLDSLELPYYYYGD